MSVFLDSVKAVPITDYAARCGFTLLKKGRYYSIREHDSVRIDPTKNCFWRNSVFTGRGTGGAGSVIDFAMVFCGYNAASDAINAIADTYGIKKVLPFDERRVAAKAAVRPVVQHTAVEGQERGELSLPSKGKDSMAAFDYLCRVRGIDLSIVQYMYNKEMLYEDERQNCVFTIGDFACVRSTTGGYMRDVPGSDYKECFYMRCTPTATTLVVAESVIDMLSVMTYFLRTGKRYTDYCYLALCGTMKLPSLYYHLERDSLIDTVYLALDNDEAGRRAAAAAVAEVDGQRYRVVSYFPPGGKDWNDFIRGVFHSP